MDFIKIIRSLEEFLYEVMMWFLFYPRTASAGLYGVRMRVKGANAIR